VGFPINRQSLSSAIGLAEGNAFSLVVEEDLVAFGQLMRKDSRRGHLGRLIVNPAFRGKGYGETLVRALLDRARRDSFERVSLNVDVENVVAVSLYVKLGFADVRRPPDEPETPDSRYMEMLV
jgi:ribosomal protein S18 acetylase RimI-like enzyme